MSDELLVSFHVVSLFTRIPTDLAVDVARRRLEDDETLPDRTNLTVDSVILLLDFCLKATYLVFRGCYYQQTFGTAMRSPVSVTVANLVMEEIEQKALSTFKTPPRFYKRYVDDTLTALPMNTISTFHEHLNSINPHIQFTVEVESNGTLPFLDVLLQHHVDGSIGTSVYRKPTHTGKYLDFSSHHPLQHKISVVRTLFTRASTLSSSMPQRVAEELVVNKALSISGYPQWIIRRHRRRPHHIAIQPSLSLQQKRFLLQPSHYHTFKVSQKEYVEYFLVLTSKFHYTLI